MLIAFLSLPIRCSLAPQYETAATTLKSHEAAEAVGGSIKLAKVDCTVEQDLCQEYGIGGYPWVPYFWRSRNEQNTDYAPSR
jgi:protein disulfide-isomerase A1